MRLTQTVKKGGCAAKVPAALLKEVLSQVSFSSEDPNVLVDGKDFDDAALYRVSSDLAMVQTLDFFTPIVDDPRTFGKVAAANSLSDVYAMGGRPATCMAILAFPTTDLDPLIMAELFQGAMEVIREARASLVGGHSIDDETLKFGFSVTGFVDPKRAWVNSKAQVGDVLILTKALGTGTLTAGLKRSEYCESDIQEALDSMSQLNNIIEDLSDQDLEAIHSATDITGFGLSGHSMQMAHASEKTFNLHLESLPLFERTMDSLQRGNLTRAHKSNQDYTRGSMEWKCDGRDRELVLHDPQTSGGLLLSVDSQRASSILDSVRKRFLKSTMIGEVQERSHVDLVID